MKYLSKHAIVPVLWTFAATFLVASTSQAQGYPTKPLSLIHI